MRLLMHILHSRQRRRVNPLLVADKIKIEKVPTSSVEKTDVLIGFSVVELPKNSLQMLDSGKFWSIFSILKIEK